MFTGSEADALAEHWIAAWNNHDLERILSHYAEDVVFSSPFVHIICCDRAGDADLLSAVRSAGAVRRTPTAGG